jgi:hypothetical protein
MSHGPVQSSAGNLADVPRASRPSERWARTPTGQPPRRRRYFAAIATGTFWCAHLRE